SEGLRPYCAAICITRAAIEGFAAASAPSRITRRRRAFDAVRGIRYGPEIFTSRFLPLLPLRRRLPLPALPRPARRALAPFQPSAFRRRRERSRAPRGLRCPSRRIRRR